MTTDFRALCIELTDCLEKADWPLRHRYVFRQWIDIARAALADEPAVPEGREPVAVIGEPSDDDDELLRVYGVATPCHTVREWERELKFAHAVLSRWGNPAPQSPAKGEVAELTGQLIEAANGAVAMGWDQLARSILRAADLLQRLSPPQPVPVGERLPGPEDCDAQGRCWVGRSEYSFPMGDTGRYGHADPEWCLELPPKREETNPAGVWLPAHALPLPEVGE